MQTTKWTWLKWGAVFLLATGLVLRLFNQSPPDIQAAAKVQLPKNLGVLSLNPVLAYQTVMANNHFAGIVADKNATFISAVRLGYGESQHWQDQGCFYYNCALLTFYNFLDGGTVEAILNLDNSHLISYWLNVEARPAASATLTEQAMNIAAADVGVQAILGDLQAADVAMVPMSGWLEDDDCKEDWCLDLTFHAPDQSGRIFHVFVNMEQQKVARTFYSRARAAVPYTPPQSQIVTLQDPLFENGCQTDYGWNVCWEMTAHDGVNFRDATFAGKEVFSSIKIGQVEVWYPSWPGGYRDEIGYQASVPPKFGTVVTDLGDGFEVRQLFTEPFDWPNCVCCYRYEQVIRFYEDGSFEPRFISHGPGCDDPSVYRPVWRMDFDIDGESNDTASIWLNNNWSTIETETEFDLYQETSALDEKLAVFDGESLYRSYPTRNDPFGVDEARVFVLNNNDGEGDEPILPGVANTFQPPSQWLNGEDVSGQNLVIWYVPILKTKKGGPWWCMPDPAPKMSPCEAVVLFKLGGQLLPPTAEEIAQIEPTVSPESTAVPASTATPTTIEGSSAQELILNAGCLNCHLIGEFGELHKVGPDLSNIGILAGERVEDLSAEEYLRQSILEPNAFVAPDCPNGDCLPNIMPGDYAQRLKPLQLDILVQFLLAQGNGAAVPTLPPAVGQGTETETTPIPTLSTPFGEMPGQVPAFLPIGLTIALIAVVLIARKRKNNPPPADES